MAARKTTTQKKTTKTTRKTTTKPKKVTIMYSPVGLTAEYMNVPLRKKESPDGSTQLVNVPLVEGLPTMLTFRKGDKMEVTPEQLEQLRALKVVETEEEHEKRIAFIKNMKNQYPEDLGAVERAEREKTLLTAWDTENRIYSDKLIICD